MISDGLISLFEIKIWQVPKEKEKLKHLINNPRSSKESRAKYKKRLLKLEEMEQEYWELKNGKH